LNAALPFTILYVGLDDMLIVLLHRLGILANTTLAAVDTTKLDVDVLDDITRFPVAILDVTARFPVAILDVTARFPVAAFIDIVKLPVEIFLVTARFPLTVFIDTVKLAVEMFLFTVRFDVVRVSFTVALFATYNPAPLPYIRMLLLTKKFPLSLK